MQSTAPAKPADLHTATPPEFDTYEAALSTALYTLGIELYQRAETAAEIMGHRRRPFTRGWTAPISQDEALDQALARPADEIPVMLRMIWKPDEVRTLRDAVKTTVDALAETARIYTERGRWARFFLVDNAGGHIHSTTACKTCRITTRFGWLPELSGLTEADAVAAHGAILCTVCFPSAPVEFTCGRDKPADPRRCDGTTYVPGSRKHWHNGNNLATCATCGQPGVRIKHDDGLTAHNNPEKVQAAREAAHAAKKAERAAARAAKRAS